MKRLLTAMLLVFALPASGDLVRSYASPSASQYVVTGGTALRSNADRFADVYNAKEYGAKGDGSTDDTAAIQAAVNAASEAGGGTVYLPRGTYKLTSAIAWKSKVSLRGDGPGVSILAMVGNLFSAIADTTTGTAESPFEDCTFKDFEIDGSGLTYADPTTEGKGIFILYMRRARFENLYIHDCIGTGLGADYLVDSVIHNVVANDNGRNWTGSGVVVGQSGIGIGTGGSVVENVTISDCHAIGNGNFGIFVEDQGLGLAPPGSRGARIVNSYSEGNRVGFGNMAGSGGTLYQGCEAHGNTEYGFYLNASIGDQLIGCKATANGIDGIYMNYPRGDFVVDGCRVRENTQVGLRVKGSSSGGGVVGGPIVISGGEYASNGYQGILIRGGSIGIANYQITGATVRDNGTGLVSGARAGIDLQDVLTDGHISGNWSGNSDGSTSQGASVQTSAGATVTNLDVTGNTTARAVGGPAISVTGTNVRSDDAYLVPTYSTTIAVDAAARAPAAKTVKIVANDGNAFTVQAPTNGVTGQRLIVRIANTSGGDLGTVTWATGYKLAAWTSPATGYSRLIEFVYDGTSWFEVSRSAADVPN